MSGTRIDPIVSYKLLEIQHLFQWTTTAVGLKNYHWVGTLYISRR